jgi:hypothetical protein
MTTTTEPSITTIDDALQAIRALRLELAELRAELANEVRTRKLVVVDASGREVLFTEEYEGAMQLHFRWPHGPGEHDYTEVVLFASEETGGNAGVSVDAGGNIYGQFDVNVSDDEDGDQEFCSMMHIESATMRKSARIPTTDRSMIVRSNMIEMVGSSWADKIGKATFRVTDS